MGPPYEIRTFDRLGLLGRRWYFRIVDTGNWEIVAQSEAYTRPHARNVTANDLSLATKWPVVPERVKA